MKKFLLIHVVLFCSILSIKAQDKAAAPVKISPDIPHDVDPKIQNLLKQEHKIYELNKKFNEYSWQAFLAINWPVDKSGKPKKNFTDEGMPLWMGWKESFEVYRPDGGKPAPWGSSRTVNELKKGLVPIPKEAINDPTARVLHSDTKRNINISDEEDQAFTGPLYDQNGNIVRYEILMNKEEFDYIIKHNLYNREGQVAFSSKPGFTAVNFPKSEFNGDNEGAIEIKLAWKILEDSDHKERYFTSESYIMNNDLGVWQKKTVGLIGFHISQKTQTGKQWVWSTFEHSDNMKESTIQENGKEVRIKPSLTDPDCEIAPVNQMLNDQSLNWTKDGTTLNFANKNSVRKTQAKRMIDIPHRVKVLNDKMKKYFASVNSVWQYYELIDTQYPLNQNALPSNPNELPDGVTNKSGGRPNIAFLTNMSMETFFQTGNQPASNLTENGTSTIQIFGTESCMGCHSSAGIYGKDGNGNVVLLGQLTGDFSWLLQKANSASGK